MAAPVAAPDEIVELHDALVATPLDDVEALRRMAFRARGLATKRPRDYVTMMTTAKALAWCGEHQEAIGYARRAFDLRFSAPQGREALAAICVNLGLMEEAQVAAGEICDMPVYAASKIAMDGAAAAAFLAGNPELLARICSRTVGIEASFIPINLMRVAMENNLADCLPQHMAIMHTHVAPHSCLVGVTVDHFSNNDDKFSVHIQHRLALELRPCLKLFDEMMLALENYYLRIGREDMAYGDVIIHGFAPMPVFRKASA